MPIGYLLTGALLACCTLLAVAPPMPATSSRMNLAFLLGFMVNEIPYLVGACLVASTALAALQGDLATPVGLVGLGLVTVAAGAIVIIARRGLEARPALAAALDRDLAAPTGDGPAMPRRQPWATILFAPLALRTGDIARMADVSYGPGGRSNLLDVYHSRSRHGGPILVYLHGGGFRSGDKNREGKPLLLRLATRGWVCVSANYRLEPDVRFPDNLIDVKRVLAWARNHGAAHGGDPSRIYVAGSSAGGHLATTAALTANDARFQPGFEHDDTAVAGAFSLYGYYGSPAAEPGVTSSPAAYLAAGAPPLFIVHGDRDTMVLVDQARRFAAEAASVSASPVVYGELPGAQHGFDVFRSARSEAVVDAIEVFVGRIDPDRRVEGGTGPALA